MLEDSVKVDEKDGYRFFMEKEIHEQSKIAQNIINERVKDGRVCLDELDEDFFEGIDEIVICACGTSYHAGLAGSYLFERLASIRTKVEPASEYRYKKPFMNKNSLFIAISQSGETADTLGALQVAKDAGLKTLVICNVENSSMVKLADKALLTKAGVERSVASTKVFTTQVLFLWLIVLYLANLRNTISKEKLDSEIKALLKVPNSLNIPENLQKRIRVLTKHYMHGHGFFFIGRDVFYPLALEGALKLKEVSYLHAEGYASGEMRHGPIALVDERLYTVALLPKNRLYEETKANVNEIISRDGHVFVISPKEFYLSDDFIQTSEQDHYMNEFFEMLVILQFFSLEISIRLGNNIDTPRNLVKSVAD
ncbi:MAG: glutamine--fructose-6-phosphate transaminase (isomerizing) [Campylobacteraceae bacterium]|nr:glutamine--fructose-6-phosphate transaminase (isomerizing) [Campylobacteraceae bacterium]